MYTSESKYLMLELRNEDTLSTFYDLYNIQKGDYQWRDFQAQWRVGVSYFDEEVFVLHEYGTGTLPGVEKLLVYNTSTREKINQINHLQPHSFTRNYVQGTDVENNIKIIDLHTGDEIDDNNLLSQDVMNTLLLPLTYKEETDNFVTVKEFVARYLQKEAVGLAEYIEYKDFIFLSFHMREELLENWLVGINSKGEVWLKEQIDKGDKYFSDTFFIWQNYLMFVVGKHELKAIKL